MNGDTPQKISSTGLIIGVILFGISGLLMPYAAKPTSNLQETLTLLSTHAFRTTLASLLMAVGFWVALIGAAGGYRSITAGGTETIVTTWARLGFYLVAVGGCGWSAWQAMWRSPHR